MILFEQKAQPFEREKGLDAFDRLGFAGDPLREAPRRDAAGLAAELRANARATRALRSAVGALFIGLAARLALMERT